MNPITHKFICLIWLTTTPCLIHDLKGATLTAISGTERDNLVLSSEYTAWRSTLFTQWNWGGGFAGGDFSVSANLESGSIGEYFWQTSGGIVSDTFSLLHDSAGNLTLASSQDTLPSVQPLEPFTGIIINDHRITYDSSPPPISLFIDGNSLGDLDGSSYYYYLNFNGTSPEFLLEGNFISAQELYSGLDMHSVYIIPEPSASFFLLTAVGSAVFRRRR